MDHFESDGPGKGKNFSAVWNFYFLAKLLLHAADRVTIDPIWNLLLLAFVAAPLPLKRRWRSPIAWCLAAALAWRETWLPSPATISEFLTDPSGTPTVAFVLEFLARLVNWYLVAALATLAAAVVWAARRRWRLWPVTLFGIAAVMFSDPSTLLWNSPQRDLDAFYAGEAKRHVTFTKAADPPFDLIFIHVCSMSWDDLRAAGLERDPFWKEFDAVFTHFTSASSDSNLSALRLLRAPCGQTNVGGLYSDAPDGCLLLDNLRQIGYRVWTAADNDLRYQDMLADIKEFGSAADLMNQDGMPVSALSFDDSRVFDDAAVLARWWSERERSGASRAGLYYNTIRLHAGTHAQGRENDWREAPDRHYRAAARELFPALTSFCRLIGASGRRAIVLLVAEHGAALEGSSIQPPDLRIIPLPQIVEVPAAIKIIGSGASAPTLFVDRPVTYLGLAELLRRFEERPPFDPKGGLAADLRDLPEPTRLVAESWESTVIESNGRWRVKFNSGGPWRMIPRSALGATR